MAQGYSTLGLRGMKNSHPSSDYMSRWKKTHKNMEELQCDSYLA